MSQFAMTIGSDTGAPCTAVPDCSAGELDAAMDAAALENGPWDCSTHDHDD